MSTKPKIVSICHIDNQKPLPVDDKKHSPAKKSANAEQKGATFKTATSAARAAEDARDEARMAAAVAAKHRDASCSASDLVSRELEVAHSFVFWSMIAISVLLAANIIAMIVNRFIL